MQQARLTESDELPEGKGRTMKEFKKAKGKSGGGSSRALSVLERRQSSSSTTIARKKRGGVSKAERMKRLKGQRNGIVDDAGGTTKQLSQTTRRTESGGGSAWSRTRQIESCARCRLRSKLGDLRSVGKKRASALGKSPKGLNSSSIWVALHQAQERDRNAGGQGGEPERLRAAQFSQLENRHFKIADLRSAPT